MQSFCFILVEDFSHLAFACAVEPLRIANLVSGQELYRWSFASESGKHAICSSRSEIAVHHSYSEIPKCDRLFVLSGINMQDHADTKLLGALRRERARGSHIGALCSGAWILAKAGLLDNMRAAIHWEYHDSFMEEFPDVNLVRSVFVADEKIVSAAGGTATADLMLNLIERDHGHDLSVMTADQMVYNTVRESSAEQRVSLQSRIGVRSERLSNAVQIMHDNLEYPLSPSEIATRVGVSTRQLERLFGKYLQTSPKKYYLDIRLEKARKLLLQTEASITQISLSCGFEHSGHFSRVFRASFGVTPYAHRNTMS